MQWPPVLSLGGPTLLAQPLQTQVFSSIPVPLIKTCHQGLFLLSLWLHLLGAAFTCPLLLHSPMLCLQKLRAQGAKLLQINSCALLQKQIRGRTESHFFWSHCLISFRPWAGEPGLPFRVGCLPGSTLRVPGLPRSWTLPDLTKWPECGELKM